MAAQLREEPATPQSDVDALGIVASQMLGGAQPTPALQTTIARATAEELDDRFTGALELAAAFRAAVDGATAIGEPPGTIRNPYKGLRAFLEADEADFFGREALVARLVDRLRDESATARFLAVVGPSGSGKSSVVRAGLVPALRAGAVPGSDRWYVIELLPGSHPLRELESALLSVAIEPPPSLLDDLEHDELGLVRAAHRVLPHTDDELLIVVDQLEEVFTLVEDERERAHVLSTLRAAALEPGSRIRIVATLRADFFDEPLSIRGFGDLLAERTEAIAPMSPDELERAIVEPAERAELHVEPSLLAVMIADVVDQPGALPLLQFALTELAERREDGALTLDGYRGIGGVSGAVAQRADRLFAAMDEGARVACRQLLLRMVTLGEGAQDTRRRVRRSELTPVADPVAFESVIDAFGRHRLLSFDRDPETREPTIEIAHEALLGSWARLRVWIEEARDDIRAQRQLSAAAAEWTTSGRDPSFLLRGARLERAQAWTETTTLSLVENDRAYLDASIALRDEENAAEREAEERERVLERRSIRRLRSLVAVLGAAALVAGTLTAIAMNQGERAGREATIATARELAAAAVVNVDTDPERSILLAMEAVDLSRSLDGSVLPEAEDAMHRALSASRAALTVPDVGGSVAWGPNGVFAAEGPRGSGLVAIRNAGTGALVHTVGDHDGGVTGVAFSADGATLATTGADGILKVWDPSTGDLLVEYVGQGSATGLSAGAEGSFAASWPRERVVRVVDLSRDEVQTLRVPGVPRATALSPDGQRIAVTTDSQTRDSFGFIVIDLETEEHVFAKQPSFGSLAWSPNGRFIAGTTTHPSIEVYDAVSGEHAFGLIGHNGFVTRVAWSSDSSFLASAAEDGEVKVWEVDGAREVLSLSSAETLGGIAGIAFSPDRSQIMFGAQDGAAVKIWDIGFDGDAEWANLNANYLLGDAEFLPGGHLAASNGEGTVTIWDTEARRPLDTIGSPRFGQDWYDGEVSVSADGRSVAVSEWNGGRVEAWGRATRRPLFTVDGPPGVSDVDWSPDGTLLLMSMLDGSAVIVDRTGNEIQTLEDEAFEIGFARFSPDGALVATSGTGSSGRSMRLWDWERARVVRELPISTGRFAFDSSGARIATVPPPGGGQPEVWNVETGEREAVLAVSSGEVIDVAFSPDGTRVATGSFGIPAVRMFDAESGDLLFTLPGSELGAWRVDFSRDGTKLAAITAGEIKVWALDIDDLLEIARREVTRSLTDEECRQFLHVERCPVGT